VFSTLDCSTSVAIAGLAQHYKHVCSMSKTAGALMFVNFLVGKVYWTILFVCTIKLYRRGESGIWWKSVMATDWQAFGQCFGPGKGARYNQGNDDIDGSHERVKEDPSLPSHGPTNV
jgi:hypothetical protein